MNTSQKDNSNVLFKSKEEAGITLRTTLLDDKQKKYNIYEFSHDDCKKYFKLVEGIKRIGYVRDGKFYVIKLDNTDFTEEFKSKFQFIDDNTIEILPTTDKKNRNTRQEVRQTLSSIENFNYVSQRTYKCHNALDLTQANNKINELNKKLSCDKYKLQLNYVFDMDVSTEVNAFSFDGSTLLLCIYNESKCVSSLVIKYIEKDSDIYIDSKTKQEFEGKKLNKLLRAVIILLSLKIFPHSKGLVSSAINPISAYTMIQHFKAVPIEEDENEVFNSYSQIEAYMKQPRKGGITTRVILNDENIRNANAVFEKIIKDEFKCSLGGKKRKSYRRRCHVKSRKPYRRRCHNKSRKSRRLKSRS